MDDVLREAFYQDDFLSRTLNTSLYDKNTLDLSFTDNNNYSHPPKSDSNNGGCGSGATLLSIQTNAESPDLDFLKLGSPDLEQMFMNIEDEAEFSDVLVINAANSSGSSRTSTSSTAAAFNFDDDLLDTGNCFTDTLQQLHDKQIQNSLDSLNLLDLPIKHEKDDDDTKNCHGNPTNQERTQQDNSQQRNIRYRQRKQSSIKLNPHKANSNSNANIKNNTKHINNVSNKSKKDRENLPHLIHQSVVGNQQNHRVLQHHQQQQVSNCIPDQMLSINQNRNQIPLLTTQQQLRQDHHQQHQQSQELASFLTQSLNNTSYQRHQEQYPDTITNSPSLVSHQNINQIPAHLQQKILEQHLIHQHHGGIGGNENVFAQNNTQINNVQRLNEINTTGIDEQTLKMFVDNPHLAPINLDIQELIKRERKKLRNRIASSKCRKRKLEREGRLEDKVRNLKEKNIELNAVANALKQQICDLKQRVMDHVSEGCQIHIPTC